MTFDGEMVIRRKRANFWSPPRIWHLSPALMPSPWVTLGTSRNT